jgi:hypothetical protein
MATEVTQKPVRSHAIQRGLSTGSGPGTVRVAIIVVMGTARTLLLTRTNDFGDLFGGDQVQDRPVAELTLPAQSTLSRRSEDDGVDRGRDVVATDPYGVGANRVPRDIFERHRSPRPQRNATAVVEDPEACDDQQRVAVG